MGAYSKSLRFMILAPVLAVLVVAGTVFYFQVLRSVEDFSDESIRANLESMSLTVRGIADAKADQQDWEGRTGDPAWTRIFQERARTGFEDFARSNDVGLIVDYAGGGGFSIGVAQTDAEAIGRAIPEVGEIRVATPDGGAYYARPISFAPWNWRITLVKDASAYESLVGEVRYIYIVTATMLLLIALLVVLWLHQALVRPIYTITGAVREGREPDYDKGVTELIFLSDSIGQMKRDLEARTLHLETALESMSDAITVFDRDMNLVAWNAQFVHLYRYPQGFIRDGLSFEEIMRYNVERGDYENAEPPVTLAGLVKRARNLDPPRFEVDRADGTSIEIRRAHMPDGGYVTTYSDITDRRQAVKAEIARREAESANEFKSKFLENMSHDLRKPVVAIIEDVKPLLEKAGDEFARENGEFLENTHAYSVHALNMIDEVLEMSRLEAGQVAVRAESTAVEPLVEYGLRVIEPVARTKGLSLKAEVEDGLEAVTDPKLLSRILINLTGNAAEYTEQGSISVSARRRGENLEITVADTGVGIPADRLEVIFEKFQQVEPVSGIVKPGMGLGLGLAISREFARLLGGEIAVESAIGEGSTFAVTVPIEYGQSVL